MGSPRALTGRRRVCLPLALVLFFAGVSRGDVRGSLFGQPRFTFGSYIDEGAEYYEYSDEEGPPSKLVALGKASAVVSGAAAVCVYYTRKHGVPGWFQSVRSRLAQVGAPRQRLPGRNRRAVDEGPLDEDSFVVKGGNAAAATTAAGAVGKAANVTMSKNATSAKAKAAAPVKANATSAKAKAAAPVKANATSAKAKAAAPVKATATSAKAKAAAPAKANVGAKTPSSKAYVDDEEERGLNGMGKVLGASLLRATANETRLELVETSQALAGKVVALYMSSREVEKELKAQNLTRNLLSTHLDVVRHRAHAAGHPFEIVYVGFDGEAEEYRDVVRSFGGWLALPQFDAERRTGVLSRYQATEIPSLVLVDYDSGKVINRGGLPAMLSEPEGFPWKAQNLEEVLADPELSLTLANGSTVGSEHLKGKNVALYFSAAWCAPCKAFTPILAQTYLELQSRGEPFEVIFISHDHNASAFQEYRATMPWSSLPLDSRFRTKLQNIVEVQGLPTLVMLNDKHQIINTEGRAAVQQDPLGENFPWVAPLVDDLEKGVQSIFSKPSMVLFAERSTASARKKAQASFEEVAKALKQDGPSGPLNFLVAAKTSEAATAVRQLCNIPIQDNPTDDAVFTDAQKSQEPACILLDLAKRQMYKAPSLDAEELKEFADAVLAGDIEGTAIALLGGAS